MCHPDGGCPMMRKMQVLAYWPNTEYNDRQIVKPRPSPRPWVTQLWGGRGPVLSARAKRLHVTMRFFRPVRSLWASHQRSWDGWHYLLMTLFGPSSVGC